MTNDATLSGLDVFTGRPLSISVCGRLIGEVQPGSPSETVYLAPGLVDLQVNGYGGFDFNTAPFADGLVKSVTEQLWSVGVTSYQPTIVTNHPDHVDSILTAIDRACNDYPLVGASISGIHLEGPFISPEDGSRGAHPKEFVVAPDWNLVARWQKAAGGRIRMLTMSPEWPGAADFITRCRANGITVAIGHTSATSEQISGAVAAGARLSTHLGNGAHAMLPRHPNYIWQQLANDELWVSVIADGFHLPDAVLKAFSRVKGNRLFLVSDSTHLAGMPPGTYQTHIGGAVTLTPDGCLQMATDPGHLAGSAQSLLRGVWNLYSKRLATLAQAWEMASPRPAAFMELAAGRLAAAAPADIVRFALTDNGLSVLQAVKDGQIVYERSIASDTVETPEIRSAFPLACQRGTRDSRTSGD